MGMPSTVTLSTTGNSASVICDWMGGKPVTATVALTSNSSGDVTVQFTLDDIMQSTSPVWVNAASPMATWASSAGGTHASSQTFGTTLVYQFNTPVAALRLSSTATSGTNTYTLKVLQGVGW